MRIRWGNNRAAEKNDSNIWQADTSDLSCDADTLIKDRVRDNRQGNHWAVALAANA
jgi:hypothetical protein